MDFYDFPLHLDTFINERKIETKFLHGRIILDSTYINLEQYNII